MNKDLKQKLEYYEQVYYSLDKPVPLKDGLAIRPVKVKDYYEFYSSLPCLQMDKSRKTIEDEFGRPKLVTDIEGIQMTYLAYLAKKCDEDPIVMAQLIQLMELTTGVQQGMYCKECGKEVSYDEITEGMQEFVDNIVNEERDKYETERQSKLEEIENKTKELLEKFPEMVDEIEKAKKEMEERFPSFDDKFADMVAKQAKYNFLAGRMTCECGNQLTDIYSFKRDERTKGVWLVVKGVEIDNTEFEFLKALIPRMNILDYDGDLNIDPELKAELDLKAKLQNGDYTSPTLEKQMMCVALGTGYSLEYLQEMTMRKLSYFLKLVDKEKTYYAQLQASMSGMVKFPEGSIRHWIFSDDKKNIASELSDSEGFLKKFDQVT